MSFLLHQNFPCPFAIILFFVFNVNRDTSSLRTKNLKDTSASPNGYAQYDKKSDVILSNAKNLKRYFVVSLLSMTQRKPTPLLQGVGKLMFIKLKGHLMSTNTFCRIQKNQLFCITRLFYEKFLIFPLSV